MTTDQQGGARNDAVRPRLASGQPTKSVQVRLKPDLRARIEAIGARTGPGRPHLVPGQPTLAVQVRLDPARRAKAESIGGGKVAKGIRAALDAYQAASLPDTTSSE